MTKDEAEAQVQQQIAEGIARFQAFQALEEIKRRHGDGNDPCPDCGSMEHFECQ